MAVLPWRAGVGAGGVCVCVCVCVCATKLYNILLVCKLVQAEYLLMASPAAVSLFHRIRTNLESFGLAITQHMMDDMRPGAGTGGRSKRGKPFLPRICSRTLMDAVACDLLFVLTYGLYQ